MSETVANLIVGIMLLGIGISMLIYVSSRQIKQLVRSKKNNFVLTIGKVVGYVNTNDEKYIEAKTAEFIDTHKGAQKIFDFIEATMPDIVVHEDPDGPAYVSIVEYEVNGKKYRVENTAGSDKKDKKGKEYKIMYNPNDPSEGYVTKERRHIITLIIIIILIAVGVGFLMNV